MSKVSFIIGTRPEVIKLAPVITRFKNSNWVKVHVCSTAQHRQMLDQILSGFGIVPDEDLDLMIPNQQLADLTARAVKAINGYLNRHRPDLLICQGDTTTTFCAALAAFYNGIPLAHVEAGLRTGNLMAPWPEEANRVLTSHITSLHFAPTERAKMNLVREGIDSSRIHVTGNTVVDALNAIKLKLQEDKFSSEHIDTFLTTSDRKIILITSHRRENIGSGLMAICDAIERLASRYPEIWFVYPVHLNPNVRETVLKRLSNTANIFLIPPLDYLSFLALLDRAYLVLTDSGGIQEEAPSFGKPVLVMRAVTERPEAVDAGTALLVGTDPDRIVDAVAELLTDSTRYEHMISRENPFGDGNASERIDEVCRRFLGVA
ncbi:UDP-N-acetylglucosamine 2-epimerase (non-hydrolyzing) [bacterium]|nr:UDP-N-acetylglucosamine 2-epimerase (non-hydrolyzing) [candidate division CSSED10-310 bacterium]